MLGAEPGWTGHAGKAGKASMSAEPLDEIIDLLRQSGPILDSMTLVEQREAFDAVGEFDASQGVTRENIELGGRPAQNFIPAGMEPENTLLYFHGGGYVMGSADSHANLTARLAAASGARVVSLDYRLAPESPFPAAVEDGLDAYRALLDGGVAPANLAIGGDSAGGGLTFATLVKARDRGLPMPASAIGLSPWMDLTARSKTHESRAAADPWLNTDVLVEVADQYLGSASAEEPLASPLFADLDGLPPIMLQVGDAEVLLDDSREFHKKATAAGVDCRLEVWDRMIHVWHTFSSVLPEGEQAIKALGLFLKTQWREQARLDR